MALKDASGLVKKYAMVNVHNYQIVATGDSVNECEQTYKSLMSDNGIQNEDESVAAEKKMITGTIKKIAEGVIEGNSHYYLLLNESDRIYDVTVSANLAVIRYNVGDSITLEYTEGKDKCTVLSISETQ